MTSKKLFLFDIDGTLISSGSVSRGLLAKAIAEETGKPVELGYHNVAGFTDRSITRNALATLDHDGAVSENLLAPILDRYITFMKEEFFNSNLPFVYKDCLQLLEAVEKAGYAACLLTGNMKVISKIKLEKFGLWDRFKFGVFADDAEEKSSMPRLARERAWDVLEESFRLENMVLVGDTIQDAEAAKENGCQSVIVCRLNANWKKLESTCPTFLVNDLSDPLLIAGII